MIITYNFKGKQYPIYGDGEIAKQNAVIESFYRIYNKDNLIKFLYNYTGDHNHILNSLIGYINEYNKNKFNKTLSGVVDNIERNVIIELTKVYNTTTRSSINQTRRVITGNNNNNKSVIVSDSMINGIPERDGFEYIQIWSEPVQNIGNISLDNGTIFRINKYEPGVAARWHQTDTMDYAIVLSGEMWMEMEEGEVHLKPGDTVVQNGTIHNWSNRGSETCIIAFVLIGDNKYNLNKL